MCEMKTTKFKMTELGPIPVDWEVKRLGECCARIKNGFTYSVCNRGAYKISRIETISKGVVNYSRVGYVKDAPPAEYMLSNGDILFSHINSLPYIGNVALYDGKELLYHGMNLLLLRCNERANANYLYYALSSAPMRSRARELAKIAINQASISIGDLSRSEIPLPPLAEQRRIAGALSDIDELISALGKLIEKKRNIKTGAMQELLGMRNEECGMRNVPRRRLPGFSGEWVEKRLGEIASFETATIGVDKIDGEWYIGTENMLAEKAGVEKNLTPVPYVTVKEYKVGDVLISNIRPYLKKIWLADRDGGCSTDVLVVRTIDNRICTPMFLKMLLSDDSFFDFTMANAVGTKMPRGDKKVIVNYQVHLPTIAEQRAIAAVLSDMDAEIAALEAKRAKYESIKQGMMQELLTGKTRLV